LVFKPFFNTFRARPMDVTDDATVTWVETTIQILTASALVGLLGAVGLRLTWHEVKAALIRCRITAILLANFLVVPALTVGAATGLGLQRDIAVAMILLAASPFAPVVPVFARMARADLALAAGLTAAFPLACALLTPVAAQAAMRVLADTDTLRFNMLTSLATLAATISLPLAAGVLVRHRAPDLGRRLLRPVEVISEATGAASLAFVTVTEFGSFVNLGWRAWLAMPAAPGRWWRWAPATATSPWRCSWPFRVSPAPRWSRPWWATGSCSSRWACCTWAGGVWLEPGSPRREVRALGMLLP
jgi:predicted Na+-dependent transporter